MSDRVDLVQDLVCTCERCQIKLPEHLGTYTPGVRGGMAWRCAACLPIEGPSGRLLREEVVRQRKLRQAALRRGVVMKNDHEDDTGRARATDEEIVASMRDSSAPREVIVEATVGDNRAGLNALIERLESGRDVSQDDARAAAQALRRDIVAELDPTGGRGACSPACASS